MVALVPLTLSSALVPSQESSWGSHPQLLSNHTWKLSTFNTMWNQRDALVTLQETQRSQSTVGHKAQKLKGIPCLCKGHVKNGSWVLGQNSFSFFVILLPCVFWCVLQGLKATSLTLQCSLRSSSAPYIITMHMSAYVWSLRCATVGVLPLETHTLTWQYFYLFLAFLELQTFTQNSCLAAHCILVLLWHLMPMLMQCKQISFFISRNLSHLATNSFFSILENVEVKRQACNAWDGGASFI